MNKTKHVSNAKSDHCHDHKFKIQSWNTHSHNKGTNNIQKKFSLMKELDLSEKDIFPLESAACWRQYVKPFHTVLFSTAKNILKIVSTQGMRLPEQVYLRAGFGNRFNTHVETWTFKDILKIELFHWVQLPTSWQILYLILQNEE